MSTSWRDDPEILARIWKVSELMDQGLDTEEIAARTGMSEPTTRRDINRAETLFRERSQNAIVEKRQDYVREGRQDVTWREDPEIMVRLEQVAQLMTQNARIWQIAEATGVSRSTAVRDIRRVEELWREAATREIDTVFSRNVAQIQRVQQEAYDSYYRADKGQRDIRWLKLVLECEEELIDLFGTKKPIKHAILGKFDAESTPGWNLSDLTDEELETLARATKRLEAPDSAGEGAS